MVTKWVQNFRVCSELFLGTGYASVVLTNSREFRSSRVWGRLEGSRRWDPSWGRRPGSGGGRRPVVAVVGQTVSRRVCRQVADELVAEFTESGRCDSPSEQQCDQKNIRRRVYDALNVLMAMNIISKEKKEIKWLGLPTNSLQVGRGNFFQAATVVLLSRSYDVMRFSRNRGSFMGVDKQSAQLLPECICVAGFTLGRSLDRSVRTWRGRRHSGCSAST